MRTLNQTTPSTIFQNVLDIVKTAIAQERLIEDRKYKVADFFKENLPEVIFYFETLPMGAGGVGSIRPMKDGDIRIQIGSGSGKYNYAPCIVLTRLYIPIWTGYVNEDVVWSESYDEIACTNLVYAIAETHITLFDYLRLKDSEKYFLTTEMVVKKI